METGTKSPQLLYLDLMKKALTFSLWEEPGLPLEKYYTHRFPYLIREFSTWFLNALQRINLGLVVRKTVDARAREDGSGWPGHAHTMIGLRRLDNIQSCVETVLNKSIEGDFIETGVWRGGACVFMRAILAAYGIKDRRVFVADSFAGLPKPDPVRYPKDKDATYYKHGALLAVSRKEVEANFARYGLLDEQVVFLPGWFRDTMPIAPVDKIAVLRLDGDLYESTIQVLTNLYPKLSNGGFCIIDDYSTETCRQAVDDFRANLVNPNPLEKIDWTGVFWRK